MSQLASNTSLSRSTRLLCYLGPPSAVLVTYYVSPKAGILSPIIFLPTALILTKWRDSNRKNPLRRGELEPMIWTGVAAATIGISFAALFQLGVCKAASTLIFGSGDTEKFFWAQFQRNTIAGLTGDQIMRRLELANSWKSWLFNCILSYVGAGFTEEMLKYLPVIYASHRGTIKDRTSRNRAYIDYVLAAALGYSVSEGVAYLYAVCESGQMNKSLILLTLFERLILGFVGHLSYACLTAIRATRRDYYGERLRWWQVVGPSALLHGTWDMAALSISALNGNVGWIHPTGFWPTTAIIVPATGIAAATVWQVIQELNALDALDSVEKKSD